MRKLQSQGGAIELTPAMREELEAAKRARLGDAYVAPAMFSRGSGSSASTVEGAEAVDFIDKINSSLAGEARVVLLRPEDVTPDEVKQAAKNAGVPIDSFAGVLIGSTKTMYVVQRAHSDIGEMKSTGRPGLP